MPAELIAIQPCPWTGVAEDVAGYVRRNAVLVESYWEEHMLTANHYRFVRDGHAIGSFAIHGGSALWFFCVAPEAAARAQELFARAKRYEQVTHAMVPAGDAFFLGHALDCSARIEKQAYFSLYTNAPPPPGAHRVVLRRVDPDGEADRAALARCGDFFAQELPQLRAGAKHLRVDVAEQEGAPVGFGVVERGRILPEISSIGMYVLEEHRRRGVGAAILRALRDRERAAGREPRSGCWYYNHDSKKTQERAGAYMASRLLRVSF
jgi:GNAT superfamily N-acetyltransferase